MNRDGRYITGPDESGPRGPYWDIAKVTNHRLHVTGDDPDRINHFVSHADLSAAPLVFRTSGDRPFKLLSALLRASQGITEAVGMQLYSRDGSNFNTVFASGDLQSDRDYYYQDKTDKVFQSGDQVLFTCSNKNGVGDVFLTLETENI